MSALRPRVRRFVRGRRDGSSSPAPTTRWTVATTPDDFRRNLATIAGTATRRGSRVILVNPVANTRFPAAAMHPNAPFFRIVGLRPRLAHRLAGDAPRSRALVEAIACHERGDRRGAEATYSALAQDQDAVGAVALNNLAVLWDESGRELDARLHWERLACSDGAAGSIAAYNLGRALATRGRHDKAREWTMIAAERDTDLYRVKAAYRDQVSFPAERTHVLDLADVLGFVDFVDYCHPTPDGHLTIASTLAALLPEVDEGESDAGYVCAHPNPDAFGDIRSTLLDYYGIDTGIDGSRIAAETRLLLDRVPDPSRPLDEICWPAPESSLHEHILNTVTHAARHPLITRLEDVSSRPPARGCEIGSFPEFYLDRLLHDYTVHAQRSDIDGVPGWGIDERRTPSAASATETGEPEISRDYGERVLRRVRTQLAHNTELFQDLRAERMLTIRWWFSREAFRYGTHSRTSMLYPLWALEKPVEALHVCLIIARRLRAQDLEESALALLTDLTRLREVHERYSARFLATDLYDQDNDYQAELTATRGRIQNR